MKNSRAYSSPTNILLRVRNTIAPLLRRGVTSPSGNTPRFGPGNSVCIRRAIQLTALISLLLSGSLAQALTLSVELNPDRVRPNEGLRAALTVTNNSGSSVSGVELRATVPSSGINTFNQSYLSGGGTCTFTEGTTNCYANERVTWNLGSIPAGEAVTVTMPMVVSNGTTAGTVITVPAQVLVNGTPDQSTSKSVTVATANALTLALAQDKNPVAPGETLTYSLTYGNRSTLNVTGTTLTLPLPAGVTFVSASGGGTLNGSNVEWALPTLLAGQSARQQVNVTVNNGHPAGGGCGRDRGHQHQRRGAGAGHRYDVGAQFHRARIVHRNEPRSGACE